MKIDFDRALPLTEIELEKLFDLVADEVNWARTQMLTAEGLDADLNIHAGEQDFMASFPPVSFGSDIALKRQILAVLCLAHNDLKPKVAGAGYDVDKYVFLVIPARHRKFMRLVSELQARLPWIEEVMHPHDESDAIAVMRRLNFMLIGASVRIRLADFNEERVVT